MPERVILLFDRAKIDGVDYINYRLVIDDPLTISVILDFAESYMETMEDGSKFIPREVSVQIADTLKDRYRIPDEYGIIDYRVLRRKRVI